MKAKYGRLIRSADKLPEVLNLNFGKMRKSEASSKSKSPCSCTRHSKSTQMRLAHKKVNPKYTKSSVYTEKAKIMKPNHSVKPAVQQPLNILRNMD